MAFVKLDCSMLNSTIWIDRQAREVFITALLMAIPQEFPEESPQIHVRSLEPTGWAAPPGWYGFIAAAGPGIVTRAGLEMEAGMDALERLGSPDGGSRSTKYDGRRLIRVQGGYLALNYIEYREKDHGSAERSRRYRERKALRNVTSRRDITQAEAEAEAEAEGLPLRSSSEVYLTPSYSERAPRTTSKSRQEAEKNKAAVAALAASATKAIQ